MPNVYLFYKRNEKEPYAYTIDKKKKKKFQYQRNMKCFYLKKVHMEKYEFMIFSNKNSSLQIIKDYLYDGDFDYEIYCSINESSRLSESCDYIYSTAQNLDDYFHNLKIPIKSKYLNPILKITNELISGDKRRNVMNINTLHLFYHLFKDTFGEVVENDN